MAFPGVGDPAALAAAIQGAIPGGGGGDPATALLGARAQTISQQAAQAAAMQQQLVRLESKLSETSAAALPSNALVDTKTLGRVEKFRGTRKDRSDWSFSFKASWAACTSMLSTRLPGLLPSPMPSPTR